MSKRTREASQDNGDGAADAMDIDGPEDGSVAEPSVCTDGADGYTSFPRLQPKFLQPHSPLGEVAMRLRSTVVVREQRDAKGAWVSWNETTFPDLAMDQPFDVLPVELLYTMIVPYMGQSHAAMLACTNRYFYCMMAPLLHATWFVTWPQSLPWSAVSHSVRYERRQAVAVHQTALMAVAEGDWLLFRKLMFRSAINTEPPAYAYHAVIAESGSVADYYVNNGDAVWNYPLAYLLNGQQLGVLGYWKQRFHQVTTAHRRMRIPASKLRMHVSLLFLRVLTYALGYDSVAYMDTVQREFIELDPRFKVRFAPLLAGAWRACVYWPFAWSWGSRALIQDELLLNGPLHMNFQTLAFCQQSRESLPDNNPIVYTSLESKMLLGATIPISRQSAAILDKFIDVSHSQWLFHGKLFPWLSGLVGYRVHSEWSSWKPSLMTAPVGSSYVEWLCRPPVDGGNTFLPTVLNWPLRAGTHGRFDPATLFGDEVRMNNKIGLFVGSGLTEVAQRFVYEHVAVHYNVAERGETEEQHQLYAQRVWNNLMANSLGDILDNIRVGMTDFIGTLYRTLGQFHQALVDQVPDQDALMAEAARTDIKYQETRETARTMLISLWDRFKNAIKEIKNLAPGTNPTLFEVHASALFEGLSRYPALEPLWFEVVERELVNLGALRHLVYWLHARGTRETLLANARLVEWICSENTIKEFLRNTSWTNADREEDLRELVELAHVAITHAPAPNDQWRERFSSTILSSMMDLSMRPSLTLDPLSSSLNTYEVVQSIMEDAFTKKIFTSPGCMTRRNATQITSSICSIEERLWKNANPLKNYHKTIQAVDSLERNPFLLAGRVFSEEYIASLGQVQAGMTIADLVPRRIVGIMRLYNVPSVQMQIVAPLLVYPQHYAASLLAAEAYPHLFGSRSGTSHDMFECMIHTLATVRMSSVDRCSYIVNHARARLWPANMTISSKRAKYRKSVYTIIQSLRNRGFPASMTATIMTAIEDVDLTNLQARVLEDMLDTLINPVAQKKIRKQQSRKGAKAAGAEQLGDEGADEDGGGDEPDGDDANNVVEVDRNGNRITSSRLRVVYYLMDRLGRLNKSEKLAAALTEKNRIKLLDILMYYARFTLPDRTSYLTTRPMPTTAVIMGSDALRVFISMFLTHGYMSFSHVDEAVAAFAARNPLELDNVQPMVVTAADFAMSDEPNYEWV